MQNKVLDEFLSPQSDSIIESDKEAEHARRFPGAFSSDQPTPFEQSGAKEMFEPSGLHNARNPHYFIQHEKGIHRLIAMMHVRGDSNKEIAKELERSEVCISNVLRQPYIQQYIVEEVKRLGGEQVINVLRGGALRAAQRILKEIDNEDTGSSQSRAGAANSLLDRVMGKAPQTVTHYDGNKIDELSDEEIVARLKEIEAQKAN